MLPVLDKIITQKNHKLQDLKMAKQKVCEIALSAAILEGQVAEQLINQKRFDDAIINIVSQASCYKDAQRLTEARNVLLKALDLIEDWVMHTSGKEPLKTLIQSFLNTL